MKFLLQIPFEVHQGAREDGLYTAEVRDMDGRTVPGTKAKSKTAQELADNGAVKRAKEWAAEVRSRANFMRGRS